MIRLRIWNQTGGSEIRLEDLKLDSIIRLGDLKLDSIIWLEDLKIDSIIWLEDLKLDSIIRMEDLKWDWRMWSKNYIQERPTQTYANCVCIYIVIPITITISSPPPPLFINDYLVLIYFHCNTQIWRFLVYTAFGLDLPGRRESRITLDLIKPEALPLSMTGKIQVSLR